MTTTINCCIKCKDGQAPTEDNVDAMLRSLESYRKRKYPDKVVVDQRQYWDHAKELDFNFAIFWDLEDEQKSI